MLIDVPSKEEFLSAGIDYSMMAYTTVLDLVLLIEEYYELVETDEYTNDEIEEYWTSARGKLKNAASLLHQGIDFMLKSKIAEVSPFLLIDTNPEKFPKAGTNGDVSYSDFFSQDSSKLPKIYSTFCKPPLTNRFFELYERSRTRRNKIIHTIDNRLSIEVKEIIKESIELIQGLLSEDWVTIREKFISNSPEYCLAYEDGVIKAKLQSEFGVLKDCLPDEMFTSVYHITKKRRFYLCPDCCNPDFVSSPIPTAILKPNSPVSNNIFCLICKNDFEVERTDCNENDCPSNVISVGWGCCSVCGEGQ